MSADLGDGLRARVEQLEQRIAAVLDFAATWERPEPRDQFSRGAAAAFAKAKQILRGDQ